MTASESHLSQPPETSGRPAGGHQPASPGPRHRARPLRRQLAVALAMTALLAVATFGLLNFVAARDLLITGTEGRLAAVGATRAATIAAGAERLVAEVAVAASDVRVANTLEDFSDAFAELETEQLTATQLEELEAFYRERVVAPLNAAGLGPFEAADLLPASAAGRWVQYHYSMRPRGEPAAADAGDGTRYSELNAEFTDAAQAFSEAKAGGDVLLIDQSGTVVYSLDKRIDVGTDLATGPLAQTALARTVMDRLPAAERGATLLTDFAVSASGRPSMYAVSALSTGSRVVGALAVEIPVAALNRLTGAAGSGEIEQDNADSYIVASDGRLQSEPRTWLEDPDGYLERMRAGDESDRAEADLIEQLGSPVGVQVIDTEPVRSALDGQSYRGSTTDYAGEATFAASGSFTTADRSWVVVTEVPRSVVMGPLGRYLLRILVVLAIVLPIVALLGAWLSRVLSRPIGPTVRAAEAIAHGDRSPDIDTSRGDEFGDLARRLSGMADTLAAHEAALTEEYERTRRLLLAVLPAELVDDEGRILGTGAATDEVTMVAVTLAADPDQPDPGTVGEALQQAAELAAGIADRTGLERVRIAADRYLFLAGVRSEDAGAEDAMHFAETLRRDLDAVSADVVLDVHIGLSTGRVATGVLQEGALTFGAWGDPVRRALALASLSRIDEVLLDSTVAQACTRSRDRLERAHDVVSLDGEAMELYTLGPPAPAGAPDPR